MFLGPCGPSCGPDDDFEDRETIRKKMSAKRMRCSEILGTSHATNPNPKQLPNNKVLGCSTSIIHLEQNHYLRSFNTIFIRITIWYYVFVLSRALSCTDTTNVPQITITMKFTTFSCLCLAPLDGVCFLGYRDRTTCNILPLLCSIWRFLTLCA